MISIPRFSVGQESLFFEDYSCTARYPRPDTLLLIHGWACDRSDWELLVSPLARTRRVITVDLPGYGDARSSNPTRYSPTSIAGLLIALLDHLAVLRMVPIGHSAGAEVAGALAVNHPGRVAALIAVDPAYGFKTHERAAVERVARQLRDADPNKVAASYFARLDSGPNTPAHLAAAHAQSAFRARQDILQEMFEQFAFGPDSFHFQPETEKYLRRRRSPMLAIYRNSDRADVGHSLVMSPRDTIVTYTGAGHWPHQEQPVRFVNDVTTWIENLGLAASPTTNGDNA